MSNSHEFIPISKPALIGNELKYVMDCVETNWISSLGSYVTAFEKSFAEFCGTEHAVTCSNGTTALHLALLALGVKPGDEVIVPTSDFQRRRLDRERDGSTPEIYLLSQDFLQSLPQSSPLSIERDVFPGWVGRGLRGYRCQARFIDIGTPESYSMAEQFFAPVTV